MFQNISPEEFKQWREQKKMYIYLDVRNLNEWEGGHFEEATLLPLQLLPTRVENMLPNKDVLIVVGCAHGRRSLVGIQKMHKLGYTNLYNLLSGYEGYKV